MPTVNPTAPCSTGDLSEDVVRVYAETGSLVAGKTRSGKRLSGEAGPGPSKKRPSVRVIPLGDRELDDAALDGALRCRSGQQDSGQRHTSDHECREGDQSDKPHTRHGGGPTGTAEDVQHQGEQNAHDQRYKGSPAPGCQDQTRCNRHDSAGSDSPIPRSREQGECQRANSQQSHVAAEHIGATAENRQAGGIGCHHETDDPDRGKQ